MEICEKAITSSSVPDGQYERVTVTESSEIEMDDTSEDSLPCERTLTLTRSADAPTRGSFRIDIEREEEKRFFSSLNQKLKKIR